MVNDGRGQSAWNSYSCWASDPASSISRGPCFPHPQWLYSLQDLWHFSSLFLKYIDRILVERDSNLWLSTYAAIVQLINHSLNTDCKLNDSLLTQIFWYPADTFPWCSVDNHYSCSEKSRIVESQCLHCRGTH